MDPQIISLNEELQDIRNKYNELREGNASKNHLNDDTPMCERHEVNSIQSEGNKNQNSHDSYSCQSLHDPNDSEKSLTELNNDVRNDLEDFKRCIRNKRTVHWKLFARDDSNTTGVLPMKKSKPINQEPQFKTDFKKLMTKFLDDQRNINIGIKLYEWAGNLVAPELVLDHHLLDRTLAFSVEIPEVSQEQAKCAQRSFVPALVIAVKNQCLIDEAYEWDEEEVSSDDNEMVEVKGLMALADDESGDVGKESDRNGEWVKISMRKVHTLLEMKDNDERKYFLDYLCIDLNFELKQAKLDFLTVQHVNTETLKENQNLRKELKELTEITETWLNSSNKLMIPMCISNVKRPWLFETEGFNLPNHDTGIILPSESQVKITNSSANVTYSLVTGYDSAEESSSVCSTPLPILEKLAGVELVSGPKTIKSILKSCSTIKTDTLKGVIINEPTHSSAPAPAKGNKNVLVSKKGSASAGKLKNVKTKDDIPLSVVMKELDDLKLQISKKQGIKPRNPQHVTKGCDTCGSKVHTTTNHNDIEWFRRGEALHAKKTESLNANRSKNPTKSFHKDHLGKFDEKADDGYFLGYSLISKAFRVFNIRRQQTEDTFHITLHKSTKAIKFLKPSVDNNTIGETEWYPPDEYLHHFNLLKEVQNTEPVSSPTKDTLAPYAVSTIQTVSPSSIIFMATPAPQDRWLMCRCVIFHYYILDTTYRGLLDMAYWTLFFVVSCEVLAQIRRIFFDGYGVLDVRISFFILLLLSSRMRAFLLIFTKDKHIELVNIVGNLGAGMLTRAMAKELSAASAHECLFVDFLFEEETKKVSEALKHPRWVDAMQEELNQFARHYLKSTPILGLCKSIAMSLVEAEYVATVGCCADILWMKSQLSDYDIVYEKSKIEATKSASLSKKATKSQAGHSKRKKKSGMAMNKNLSQPSASTPMVIELHKEAQQATSGPASLWVIGEVRADPQPNSCDNHDLSRWCHGGDDESGGVKRLWWQTEEGEARGGEWVWGSNRSGDEECFWSWPKKFPTAGGGGRVVAGGGRKIWWGREL
ncbi:hypothetical protein Tco_0247495 [Tanacetum coccineum]